MIRPLLLACALVVVWGAPAPAQPPAQGAAAATPQISSDQARQVLNVLNDPAKRAQFTATLEAIVKSLPASAEHPTSTPPTEPAAASPLPLAPNSLGADVLVGVSNFLNRTSNQALDALHAIHSVPLLWGWIQVMAFDPWARGVLVDTAWRLVLALAAGMAVEWLIGRTVRRPILALVRQAPNGGLPLENGEARAEAGDIEPPRRRRITALMLLRRVPLVVARLLLELLPVLGFLLVGHLVAFSALGGENISRLVLLAVVDAYALCAAILCVARMLFSPGQPRLRLLHVADATAVYAVHWVRRIAVVSVFGYACAEVGLLLGMWDAAHDALLKAIGLVDHLFLAIIVLQQRRAVRQWIRAPQGATGFIAAWRNRLARVWHWIAIAVLAAFWLVWAVEIPHGYEGMLRFFGATILVLITARLVQIVILGMLDRMLHVPSRTAERYPSMEGRLARYHPVLSSLARALILLVSAIVLLQLWGLGALDWLLASTLGERMISAFVTLALTGLLAFAAWEAANAAIERHLTKLANESQLARSARLRTLLPLLRTTLLISILIIAGMMVLSEIGVNIGPLLAGAGIIGVAIGFGSQKLVQDLITGIFLLLENAMQVGDYVTVSGLSGTVENLSIRTIRLRAGDGSVHVIPFSAVTSVTNVNRGLGNASVSVAVAYGEDTDRVSAVLNEIAAGMRQEPDFAPKMLSDLQLWGVDKVDGAAVTIVGQVVCTDSGRWSVQREFNRRMKQRFQQLGIELYNPKREIALMPTPKEPDPS